MTSKIFSAQIINVWKHHSENSIDSLHCSCQYALSLSIFFKVAMFNMFLDPLQTCTVQFFEFFKPRTCFCLT